MSTAGLPTIWELVADAAAALPEPFSRAALINWVSARRPDVGVASIASHIQFATDNSGSAGHNPFSGRTPLLHRVDRGLYRRYRPAYPARHEPEAGPAGSSSGGSSSGGGSSGERVLLVGSSGGTGRAPRPAAELFGSPGFARARDAAVRSGLPWFVLSAKHGLLDPGDVVGPFDVLFGDQTAGYRGAWAEWVVVQLADRVRLPGVTVEVHGGVDFAQALRGPLARRGATLEIPLPDDWAEAHAGWDAHEPPVRAALGRLRGLVGRS
jgi:hypothetical protein